MRLPRSSSLDSLTYAAKRLHAVTAAPIAAAMVTLLWPPEGTPATLFGWSA